MKHLSIIGSIAIPSAVAAVGSIFLVTWLGARSGQPISQRLPQPDAPGVVDTRVVFPGTLVLGQGVPAELGGSWPRFRGPNGDGISTEAVPLADTWTPAGPALLWSVDLGRGYAGAAVMGGKVYVLDYDRQNQADTLRCLSLADGRQIWSRSYPVHTPPQHGFSRTVPAVTEKYVVTIGPKCHVMCADARTGGFLWGIDLVGEYGTEIPPWYTAQCPLIDGETAIIAPGGSSLMIAVDCASGDVLWKTPNPNGWRMTHSSITVMDWAGVRMYVYCADGGVVGVRADDGSILWEYPLWRVPMSNAPAPVVVPGGRIFLTGGYRAGSMMLQLEKQAGRIVPRELFRLKQDAFGSEMQTPILYGDYIYGTLTKDARRLKEQILCMDLQGRRVWASGEDDRFGPYGGPYIVADGKIIIMNDDGVLTLLEATPEGFRRLARAKVLQGPESWAPMALAGGRLILRDLNRMICLDMR